MSGEYAIGIDLGATNVRVGVGDNKGHILKRLSEKTDKQHGPEGISAQLIRMIRLLLKEIEPKIRGIGIGSIGPLDLRKGAITESPNIPFNFVPLTEPIRSEFGAPLTLLNDCNAAVVGEREFGAGRGVDNVAYITLSTGIGGGVYVDGHLLRGKDGNAAEVGHMVIDFEGRLECGCGKRGHWEAYCSGENIPNYVRMLLKERTVKNSSLMKLAGGDPQRITAKILYEAARNGDTLSLGIVDSIGRLNAAGFANVINAYDPSIITVGGTLALKHEDLIIKPIKRYVDDYAINRVPEIRITPLGEDAVLLGAIAVVYKQNQSFV
ncbi:MAG: ROK family protein [Candidatus Bathyarchaeia archaeon]